MVAYGFARLQAPGKGFFFVLLLSTLMLPYPVTMVPLFIIFSKLGLINSFVPLILPTFFGNAFYIFLLRQSFKQIPPDLEDAARMDGAGTLQVLWNVILPLSRPALATVAIFTFQAAWNDFLGPLIFLHDQSLYTLQLGLSLFRGAYNVQWAYLMAASLVVTLPVIAIFFFAQRSFIEGVGFTGTDLNQTTSISLAYIQKVMLLKLCPDLDHDFISRKKPRNPGRIVSSHNKIAFCFQSLFLQP